MRKLNIKKLVSGKSIGSLIASMVVLAFAHNNGGADIVRYRYAGYGKTSIPRTSNREYPLNGYFSLDDSLFGTTQPILSDYEFAGPRLFDEDNSFLSRNVAVTDAVGNIVSLDLVLGAVDESYAFTHSDWVYTGAINFDGEIQHQVEGVRTPIVARLPMPTVGNVTMDWVAVGDTRNPGYLNHGRVDQGYRIGKYEVTNGQYADFLNRKAQFASSDNLGLYDERMWSDPRGGIVRDGDGVGLTPYRYRVKPFMADKPVNFVSFYDALRFTNWLHNGQSNGKTEQGAYELLGGTEIPTNIDDIERQDGAAFFLPTADEWFKAGYYEPGVSGNSYWRYATRSDVEPETANASAEGDVANPGTNVVNYQRGADWSSQDGHVTSVGTTGLLSESYYGAADMNGNVWEWTEEVVSSIASFRNTYGGSFFDPNIPTIPAAGRDTRLEASATMGFRVAARGLGLVGDFDLDNRFTVADIDLLTAEVRAGSFIDRFDLNNDEQLDSLDRDVWIRSIAGTLPGDVDLNKRVEFADFLVLSGQYGNDGGWGAGDLDGNGAVGFPDFLLLSANFGQTAATPVSVPEASSGMLFAFAAVLLSLGECRKQSPRCIRRAPSQYPNRQARAKKHRAEVQNGACRGVELTAALVHPERLLS